MAVLGGNDGDCALSPAGCRTGWSTGYPLPCRIVALRQEQNRLFAYSLQRLAGEIGSTGFRCAHCGNCCTQAVNGHVFLLDRDAARLRTIDSAACVPAPDPGFCDQNGVLYVSGYALRMRVDEAGSCWFLEGRRCRIYPDRFSICRIYPPCSGGAGTKREKPPG